MRIFLTIALLATVLVAVPAAKADACSCALMSTQDMLQNHEAAFVGTMTERGSEVFQDPNTGESIVFTFEVEQWLKGDLGDTIEVRSATNGAACGFEIPVGERAAIFLYRNAGNYWSGLCSTMSAEVALAGMVPLEIGSTDPPFAIIYGGSGDQRLMVIDRQGDVISILPEADRDSWQQAVSVCPGGARLLETSDQNVRVRSVPDLAIEREFRPGGDYVQNVWCRSEDGTQTLSQITISGSDNEITRLVDQDGRPFFEGRAWVADVVDDTAYVAANEGKLLIAIDLTSAESKVVYRTETAAGGYGGIEVMAKSGSMLTFVSNAYTDDETRSVLVVVDGESAEVVAERQLEGTATAHWIGPDLIGVTSNEEGAASMVYDATTLDEVREMPSFGGMMAVAGDLGVGMQEGKLVAFSKDEVREIRTYPNAYLWSIAVIDPTVAPEVPDDAPIITPTTTTPTTVPTETTLPPQASPPADPPPESGMPSGVPWLIGAAGLLITAAVVAFRRKQST